MADVLELTGPDRPVALLDAFEGRRQPIRLRSNGRTIPSGPASRPGAPTISRLDHAEL
ncbi:hypothetical protein AB0436_04990 [Streptomyces sp. NPDC051322]|uniref:hypothetical protein n=1 Tax=Streptomyces sp. NPDC051322 TaxID=3154645 RepID=UPI00345003E2